MFLEVFKGAGENISAFLKEFIVHRGKRLECVLFCVGETPKCSPQKPKPRSMPTWAMNFPIPDATRKRIKLQAFFALPFLIIPVLGWGLGFYLGYLALGEIGSLAKSPTLQKNFANAAKLFFLYPLLGVLFAFLLPPYKDFFSTHPWVIGIIIIPPLLLPLYAVVLLGKVHKELAYVTGKSLFLWAFWFFVICFPVGGLLLVIAWMKIKETRETTPEASTLNFFKFTLLLLCSFILAPLFYLLFKLLFVLLLLGANTVPALLNPPKAASALWYFSKPPDLTQEETEEERLALEEISQGMRNITGLYRERRALEKPEGFANWGEWLMEKAKLNRRYWRIDEKEKKGVKVYDATNGVTCFILFELDAETGVNTTMVNPQPTAFCERASRRYRSPG